MRYQRFRCYLALIAIVAAISLVVPTSPSSARSDSDFLAPGDTLALSYYDNCGRFWPSSGVFQTEVENGAYETTWEFRLTNSQWVSLQCLKNRYGAEFVELDFRLIGFEGVTSWNNYVITGTNLPGAIHDEGFTDLARDASPGVTNIHVDDLRTSVTYYVSLAWNDSGGLYADSTRPQRVSFEWVPSHWSRTGNATETVSCANSIPSQNWAWCIFPNVRAYV